MGLDFVLFSLVPFLPSPHELDQYFIRKLNIEHRFLLLDNSESHFKQIQPQVNKVFKRHLHIKDTF